MHEKLLTKRPVPRNAFQEQMYLQRGRHSRESKLFKELDESGNFLKIATGLPKFFWRNKQPSRFLGSWERYIDWLREWSPLQAWYIPVDPTLNQEATQGNKLLWFIFSLAWCYTKAVILLTIKLISQETF